MGKLFLELTLAVLLLTLAPPSAGQQATSEIRGRAADQNDGGLAGVTVVLTNEDTGTLRETTSGADGSYLASQLVPGRYRIVASLRGFRKLELPGLVLQVGTTLTINLPLEVGPLEETITVRTATPLIDLASTEVGGHIGTADLSQLPAMNRSSFATIALLPGIQLVQTNQMGNDTIAAGGQASQNTNISLDGGYNTDDTVGGTYGAQVRTPLESIQEFQVETSMYGAEDGRAERSSMRSPNRAPTRSAVWRLSTRQAIA
jgi:Carboxypeptidase regulatory-like domain